MSVLQIVKYPEKILREKTEKVAEIDGRLQDLIDDMIETMYAAPGVGLAANQVGVAKQLTVIDVSLRDEKSPLIVIVNPEIVHMEDEIEAEEGCLSIPNLRGQVPRHTDIEVQAHDTPHSRNAKGSCGNRFVMPPRKIDFASGYIICMNEPRWLYVKLVIDV